MEKLQKLMYHFSNGLRGNNDSKVVLEVLIPLMVLKYLNDQAKHPNFELKIPSEGRWEWLSQGQGHHIIESLLTAYTELERDNPSLKEVFTKLEVVENHRQIFYQTPDSIDVLLDFIDGLSLFDFTQADFSFSDLFEWLLDQFHESYGRKQAPGVLPRELAQLMTYFLPQEPVNIYNPYAGMADFALHIPNNHFCYGQEANNTTWAMGKLRLLIHHKQQGYALVNETLPDHWLWNNVPEGPLNAFLEAFGNHNGFDVLMNLSPFNLKIHDEDRIFLRSEAWILSKLLESFYPHQRAIVLLSSGTLFRGGKEGEIRKSLIKKDLIETIISLPAGLLNHTSIPLVLLVMNGSKPRKDHITLIDATDCVVRQRRQSILQLEEVLDLIETSGATAQKTEVSTEEVASNDYNLNLPRYFIPVVEAEPESALLPLGKLLTPAKKNTIKDIPFGRLLKISDLSDDIFSYRQTFETLEPREIGKSYRLLKHQDFLLSRQGGTLRPTLYEATPGIDVYHDASVILAFKVKEDIVNTEYLVNELNADYVQTQLTKYSHETVLSFPYITKDSLLKHIKIQVPSLEVQKARVKRLNEQSTRLKQLQEEKEAILSGNAQQQYADFASFKHTLGTPRQNILLWADLLEEFFSEMQSEAFQEVNQQFTKFIGDSFGLRQVASKIKQDILHISHILEGGVREFDPSTYKLEPVSLDQLRKLINELGAANYTFYLHKNFSADFDQDIDDDSDEPAQGLDTNLTLLKTLLDNLLTNASKHGFETRSKEHKVMIDLSLEEGFLIMEVKNNGKPFPSGYTKERFITKFSTNNTSKGSGLGGYDIDRIAQYLGNKDWELLPGDKPYRVIFRFQFKLIPIN